MISKAMRVMFLLRCRSRLAVDWLPQANPYITLARRMRFSSGFPEGCQTLSSRCGRAALTSQTEGPETWQQRARLIHPPPPILDSLIVTDEGEVHDEGAPLYSHQGLGLSCLHGRPKCHGCPPCPLMIWNTSEFFVGASDVVLPSSGHSSIVVNCLLLKSSPKLGTVHRSYLR